jgi:hypothetical protein
MDDEIKKKIITGAMIFIVIAFVVLLFGVIIASSSPNIFMNDTSYMEKLIVSLNGRLIGQ